MTPAVLHYFQEMIPQNWKILITGATSIHGWPIFTMLAKLTGDGRIKKTA